MLLETADLFQRAFIHFVGGVHQCASAHTHTHSNTHSHTQTPKTKTQIQPQARHTPWPAREAGKGQTERKVGGATARGGAVCSPESSSRDCSSRDSHSENPGGDGGWRNQVPAGKRPRPRPLGGAGELANGESRTQAHQTRKRGSLPSRRCLVRRDRKGRTAAAGRPRRGPAPPPLPWAPPPALWGGEWGGASQGGGGGGCL